MLQHKSFFQRLTQGNVCNLTGDVTDIMDQTFKHDLNQIFKIVHGLIPFPIVVCGLILSLVYIAAVIKAIRQHRVSRKCYVLLVNRASGDVLTCLIAGGMAIYTMCVETVSREAMQILDVFIISAFWSAMISYVALSLIKLYAVWQPLNYRKKVTMRRCIYLAAFSWIFFLVMALYALSVILAVINPTVHAWVNCRRETCIRYMYKTRNFMMIIAYFITLACFTVTVILIQRARRFVSSFSKSSNNSTSEMSTNSTTARRRSLKQRFPLWKLAINVGTFAFFNVFYVIWAVVLVINTDKCFFRRHFNLMVFLLGLVRISLLLRIAIDPIVAFITDFQIRRSLKSMFPWNPSKIQPSDSNRRPFARQSQMSEDNSSEGTMQNRLQRQSTRTSQLPDRPSIKSISGTQISDPLRLGNGSLKSTTGSQKILDPLRTVSWKSTTGSEKNLSEK